MFIMNREKVETFCKHVSIKSFIQHGRYRSWKNRSICYQQEWNDPLTQGHNMIRGELIFCLYHYCTYVFFCQAQVQSIILALLALLALLVEVVIAINRSYPYRQLPYRLPTGKKLNLLSLTFTSTSLHNWLQKEPKK